MEKGQKFEGRILVKNTALNFIGQAASLLVALFTIPYIVHGLGVERFGILSLAWVILGYFNLFDLGLGRATTKFVAEALGKGETENIPTIAWTSFALISFLGLIGSAVLVATTPLLVIQILNVPDHLTDETKMVFYIFSAGILAAVMTASLSGILEAYQRFDLVNVLRAPSAILSSLIPAGAIFFGANLSIIVFLLVIKDFFLSIFYIFFCIRVMPKSAKTIPFDLQIAPKLFAFGGWMTVISTIAPILVNIDRLLIGSLLSLAAVAYYTVPYDVVNKLWIFPFSLYMTLFPAFSAIGIHQKKDLEHLFAQASKFVILSLGFLVLPLFIFANEILEIWLGNEFSQNSSLVFQILLIGFFLNAQAWIPSTLLQGIGRPDVVAKLFLLELPLYLATLWFLINKMGIEGAALAWALRGAAELTLFHIASWKIIQYNSSTFRNKGTIRGLGTLAISAVALLFAKNAVVMNFANQFFLAVSFLTFTGFMVWYHVLDINERYFILQFLIRARAKE